MMLPLDTSCDAATNGGYVSLLDVYSQLPCGYFASSPPRESLAWRDPATRIRRRGPQPDQKGPSVPLPLTCNFRACGGTCSRSRFRETLWISPPSSAGAEVACSRTRIRPRPPQWGLGPANKMITTN